MLKSRCSEITDEVMSLDNAYPMDCGKIPSKKKSTSSKKKLWKDKYNVSNLR
jgi:hypothetical protein